MQLLLGMDIEEFLGKDCDEVSPASMVDHILCDLSADELMGDRLERGSAQVANSEDNDSGLNENLIEDDLEDDLEDDVSEQPSANLAG